MRFDNTAETRPLPAPPVQLSPASGAPPSGSHALGFGVRRSRAYSFVLDARGMPIEVGSGRFAKVFLGEEAWLESKTHFKRPVVLKVLQRGASAGDRLRFQMEMEILERVQGHPNIVELYASGGLAVDGDVLPAVLRDVCESEFMILERLDMSLEERLKGSREGRERENLLAYDMQERLLRVLDVMLPVASAIEYAHVVRNISHRDIKPANVLIALPDPRLRGSTLQVRLADFNVGKLSEEAVFAPGITCRDSGVPGSLFFQSPEQETNIVELLVDVREGLAEVEYFEDFYIEISKSDTFSLFNSTAQYPILYADRGRKRLVLERPYAGPSETNVRARVQKSVGRPADIYALGAMLYYLISGAYANPKTLYDAFHKFIEYERVEDTNTIEDYLRHEYDVIASLRGPRTTLGTDGQPAMAPSDHFFSYKHYLDGNGELIEPNVMLVIGKCMIRNKPDSYCRANDLETSGVSDLVTDLGRLDSFSGSITGAHLVHRTATPARSRRMKRGRSALAQVWRTITALFQRRG